MDEHFSQSSRRSLVTTLAAALFALLVVGGCASGPQVPPPDGISEMNAAEVLYEAVVSTYESRDLPIDVSSDKFFIVTSEFQREGPNLRKRMNTRIIRAPAGAMGLNVTAEWEKKTTGEDGESWETVNNEELRKRSEGDEIALARAIEKRFEAWKKEAQSNQDE